MKRKVDKCEYCEEGLCTYSRTVDEQENDERDGIPCDWCDGSQEEQNYCFKEA